MRQQVNAKSGEPILVGEDQHTNFTRNNAIHHAEELFALKVQSTANFCDPLIDQKSTPQTKLFERFALVA